MITNISLPLTINSSYIEIPITYNPQSVVNSVSGITISPKKNFCIVKIWMSNCSHHNPDVITSEIKDIGANGCLFKKHVPEY